MIHMPLPLIGQPIDIFTLIDADDIAADIIAIIFRFRFSRCFHFAIIFRQIAFAAAAGFSLTPSPLIRHFADMPLRFQRFAAFQHYCFHYAFRHWLMLLRFDYIAAASRCRHLNIQLFAFIDASAIAHVRHWYFDALRHFSFAISFFAADYFRFSRLHFRRHISLRHAFASTAFQIAFISHCHYAIIIIAIIDYMMLAFSIRWFPLIIFAIFSLSYFRRHVAFIFFFFRCFLSRIRRLPLSFLSSSLIIYWYFAIFSPSDFLHAAIFIIFIFGWLLPPHIAIDCHCDFLFFHFISFDSLLRYYFFDFDASIFIHFASFLRRHRHFLSLRYFIISCRFHIRHYFHADFATSPPPLAISIYFQPPFIATYWLWQLLFAIFFHAADYFYATPYYAYYIAYYFSLLISLIFSLFSHFRYAASPLFSPPFLLSPLHFHCFSFRWWLRFSFRQFSLFILHFHRHFRAIIFAIFSMPFRRHYYFFLLLSSSMPFFDYCRHFHSFAAISFFISFFFAGCCLLIFSFSFFHY